MILINNLIKIIVILIITVVVWIVDVLIPFAIKCTESIKLSMDNDTVLDYLQLLKYTGSFIGLTLLMILVYELLLLIFIIKEE